MDFGLVSQSPVPISHTRMEDGIDESGAGHPSPAGAAEARIPIPISHIPFAVFKHKYNRSSEASCRWWLGPPFLAGAFSGVRLLAVVRLVDVRGLRVRQK